MIREKISDIKKTAQEQKLLGITSLLDNFATGERIYYQGDEPNNINIIPANWDGLRSGLITSKAFVRAIQNPNIVNQVAYGALQSVLSTEGSEADLKAMLQYAMTYSEDEKAEINKLLSDNYFTIQL